MQDNQTTQEQTKRNFIPDYLDLHTEPDHFTKSYANFVQRKMSQGIVITQKLMTQ